MAELKKKLIKFELKQLYVKLNAKILNKKRKPIKNILNNINLDLKVNSLNVLIGPSGSGKTSLLNYLASINFIDTTISYDGQIYVNGSLINNMFQLKSIIGFVPQFDILDPNTTPNSYYTYICKMLGIKNYKKKIDNILKILNIEHIKDIELGDELNRKISGGELKRVSIGLQLLRDTKILILDEPTTGLDSESALLILEYLKKLTKSGLTVITTLHQPSSEIISLTDNLIILNEGYLVYNNPIDNLKPFFENKLNKTPTIESILEYLDKDYLKIEEEKLGNLNLTEEMIDSKNLEKIKLLSIEFKKFNFKELNLSDKIIPINLPNRKRIFFLKEFFLTFIYLSSLYYKNLKGIYMRLFQIFVLLWIQYGVYNDLGDYKVDTATAIQNRAGLMFITNMGFSNIGLSSSFKIFIPRRAIYLNENNSQLHRSWIYVICFQLYEIPFIISYLIIYCICFVFLFKFSDFKSKFNYILELFMIFFFSIISNYSIGVLISPFAKNLEQVATIFPIIITPLNLMSGYLMKVKEMAPHMVLISYISNIKYCFQYLILLVFDDRIINKDCYINGQKIPYENNPICNPFVFFEDSESKSQNLLYIIIFILILRIWGLIVFCFKYKDRKIKNIKL